MIDYRSAEKCADGTRSWRIKIDLIKRQSSPLSSETFHGKKKRSFNTLINVMYIDFVRQLNAMLLRWLSPDSFCRWTFDKHREREREKERASEYFDDRHRPRVSPAVPLRPYSKKNGSNSAKKKEKKWHDQLEGTVSTFLSFSDVAFCQRCYLRSRRESTTRGREREKKEWGSLLTIEI